MQKYILFSVLAVWTTLVYKSLQSRKVRNIQIHFICCFAVMAAASIANIVKSSLGPVGLDKMLVDDIGVSANIFLSQWPVMLRSYVLDGEH